VDLFIELGILIAASALISIVMRILRQPLIIGYIITGFIVGPYVFNIAQSEEVIRIFAELGIAFLLFIVGLNLSPKVFKEVGVPSLVTGLGQIVFTSVIGYIIVQLFGFDVLTSWYIAIALTFSSTIIILKLLSDKGDMETLYGKISIGFLLLQDVVATIILIVAASSRLGESGGGAVLQNVLLLLGKGAVLTVVLILISTKVLSRLTGFLGRSQELLFMFSIGWGLGVAALFYSLGLSIEVGALIGGVALALSPFHHEMSAKMRPLRDFFIVVFFIFLGSQLSVADLQSVLVPALILSAFVLVGNPLIVMALMGAMGYRKRTGFFAGLTVAQISEFSLILILLGIKNGQIAQSALSLVTVVGVVTIAASTYMILYADKLYAWLGRVFSIFERTHPKERTGDAAKRAYETILFGCNRTGHDIVEVLSREGRDLLVVDYNPEIISYLRGKGITCVYGDAEDAEFVEELRPWEAKMVISTIAEPEGALLLLEKIRSRSSDTIVILTSQDIPEAERLYKEGVSYVIMPHFLGATYAAELLRKNKFASESFAFEKTKHLSYLETKKQRGHTHPHIEKFEM